MSIKKLFPPQMSQILFVDSEENIGKINSLDYDIFIWLIYHIDKNYYQTNSLICEFEYKNIKEDLVSKPNTKSIQQSLMKLNEYKIHTNILESYGDKRVTLYKPFEIELKYCDNSKSYGFSVKILEEFITLFKNPSPNVEVKYDIIYSLNKVSKFIYLFLRDSLGKYQSKSRNIDIENLKTLTNMYSDISNSNFMTQLKKTINEINEKSDIIVSYDVEKKRDLKSGLSYINKIKFNIKKSDKLLQKKKIENQTTTDSVNVLDESDEMTFESYLQKRVDEDFEKSYHKGIENIDGYKYRIRMNLIKDGLEDEFHLLTILSNVKQDYKEFSDKENNVIYLYNIDDENDILYFNDSGLLVRYHNEVKITNSIKETIQKIDGLMGDYNSNIFESTNKKYLNKFGLLQTIYHNPL